MCELCDLVAGNRPTKVWYEDKDIVIVDCLTCGVPMVVWKEHKAELTQGELSLVMLRIVQRFPRKKGYNYTVRLKMRKITDHWHCHLDGFKEPKNVS